MCALALALPLWSWAQTAPSGADASRGFTGVQGSAASTSASDKSLTKLPADARQALEALRARPSTAVGDSDDDQRRYREGFRPDRGETAVPAPPAPPTEFELLVEQSVGTKVPIFGQNLFQGTPSTFAPLDRVPVTADYVIGPGDEILLRVWGQVDMDLKLAVDRNGTIFVPEVGNVSVAGVTYQNLGEHMKKALGRVFRNFELNASLGQLRSIQVFLVGAAKRPGAYTVSSLSTLVNALFVSGGPSSRGSMRQIQVKRGSKVVTSFDLYQLIVHGDKTRDVQLLPGDVIYIPSAGPQVAIHGSVNVPAIYEFKTGETFARLLEWAGGLTTTAASQKIVFERIAERKARRVEAFEVDAARRVALQDGDLINVQGLTNRFTNAVTLRGHVAQPMRFPWREGLRVSDLIPDKEALIVGDYWLKKNRLRSEFRSDPAAQFAPTDAVTGQKKIVDEIRAGDAEVNWDYAVVERLHPDLTTMLLPFNLGRVVLERDPRQDLLLQPGDTVTIFSKKDIQAPIARQTKFVRLEGEFANAGVYRVEEGETLRQLVARVGGLTPNAYVYGAQLSRESTRIIQQQKIDEMVSRLELELERGSRERAGRVVSAEDAAIAKTELESLRNFLAKMRRVKAGGRIVLDIAADDAGVKAFPDLALEDGDRVFVPNPSGSINVLGAVFNENAFIYRPERRMSDYLAMAGGPLRSADEGSIYLVRANGTVASRRQSAWVGGIDGERLAPGDTVVVPEDFSPKISWVKDLKDWSQIMYQFALAAAGLKSIR
ncbi:MAG: SLBB domain-containing protein [Betaproteobacteria bacterium]|nr:SLBB domain-containing protein [Betaproteobacteria bacterium]